MSVNVETIVAFFGLSYAVCWLFGCLAGFAETHADEGRVRRKRLENSNV